MLLTDAARDVPAWLRADEFLLRPITAADAARDHEAVMESRQELRLWEQSSWPADTFTVEENAEDLADLERRHLERRAFTYTVLDPHGPDCLGCVYIFPTTATFLTRAAVTAVSGAEWADVDAVVYFWIRTSLASSGLEARLLSALRGWLAEDWSLSRVVFVTNEQCARQVRVLQTPGLRLQFELREPGKAGTYLVYGETRHDAGDATRGRPPRVGH